MEDEEHYAEAGREFGKGSQQSYGVGAAADGHADALAGTDEAMLAQVLFEAVKHRNIIAEARAATGECMNTKDRKFFSDCNGAWADIPAKTGCCCTNTESESICFCGSTLA
jgi:hypothetical protein